MATFRPESQYRRGVRRRNGSIPKMLRVAFLVAVLGVMPVAADAAELRLFSSNAMREALRALAPAFETASGHKVAMTFIGSAEMLKRLRAGETADVIVLQASSIDELAATGLVVPGSRVDFARYLIAAAVRAGTPRPDISSASTSRRFSSAWGSRARKSCRPPRACRRAPSWRAGKPTSLSSR